MRSEKYPVMLDMQADIVYIACMTSRQYTIRQVPEAVDQALRASARKSNKSLNEVLLSALEGAAGEMEYHDLDFLAGSWAADAKTDRALKDQRGIDSELWR